MNAFQSGMGWVFTDLPFSTFSGMFGFLYCLKACITDFKQY